jgi:signal transduction histidine kinase
VLLNLGLREAIVQLVEDVGTRNQWDTALDLPETLPRLNDLRPSRCTASCRNR